MIDNPYNYTYPHEVTEIKTYDSHVILYKYNRTMQLYEEGKITRDEKLYLINVRYGKFGRLQ